jgi:selenocysteine-specific elongation factor
VAGISLYGKTEIMPGETLFARVTLPEPALLLPGDRFIIRQLSPVVTIGGGVVLDAAPIKHMPGHESFLQVLGSGNPGSILRARIARRGHEGISMSRLVAETGWRADFIEGQLREAVSEKRLVRVGDRLVHGPALLGLQQLILSTVADFLEENSLVGGIAKEQLRQQVRASAGVFSAALELLVRHRMLEVAGDLVRLPGHGVVMKDEEAESKKKIEEAFATAGLKVPALHEVIVGLRVDKEWAQKIVTLLLREKTLVKVSQDLVFHRTALEELRRRMAAEKARSSRIDVARFKELAGVSRKYAIPLLEYLDRERVTKRVGDEREIL